MKVEGEGGVLSLRLSFAAAFCSNVLYGDDFQILVASSFLFLIMDLLVLCMVYKV